MTRNVWVSAAISFYTKRVSRKQKLPGRIMSASFSVGKEKEISLSDLIVGMATVAVVYYKDAMPEVSIKEMNEKIQEAARDISDIELNRLLEEDDE